MKNRKSPAKTVVVHFHRDASFYLERGMRLAQRSQYEKALRYLRRAVELAPDNAIYLCHLASLLAETGQFEESNDILHHILDKVDPSYIDVYFYLANNYASMDDFHMAEEMALRYLQETSDGTYAYEAEELLDYIYFELDLPPRRFLSRPEDDVHVRHEHARLSLEEGRFLEATGMLEELTNSYPDYIPAWNNLALAYYYTGNFSKAMETIEKTLDKEPGNLHALCNLAVLLAHHNRIADLAPLICQLKKVVPYHHDHMYKLATTMGVLGQHEEAYRLYSRLLRLPCHHDAATYHYAAIAAYYTDRFEQAVRWWQKARQIDPDSGVADYYLEWIGTQTPGAEKQLIPYQYQHPDRMLRIQEERWPQVADFKNDPMVRASLLWALQHGRDEAKETVIHTLALIGDHEAIEALKTFFLQTDDPDLQKLVLLVLSEMGAELPCLPKRAASPHASVPELMNTAWKQVQDGRLDWAKRLWNRYTRKSTEVPHVRKPVAWVAALEYLFVKYNGQRISQQAVAQKYGVAVSTVAKCIRELEKIDLEEV
jgi:tetratricopeptide (TPR) repeat protein